MLIKELERVFGGEMFDATDVMAKTVDDQALTAAIDAEVPRARKKSGYRRGQLNPRAIRMALRRMQGEVEVQRHAHDYWSFRCVSRRHAGEIARG